MVENAGLSLSTPIPSPYGWTTMGHLVEGAVIFGDDGHHCLVTQAHEPQIGQRCFEVRFSDGSKIVASAGHWWQTKVAGSNAKPRRRTTLEMFEDDLGRLPRDRRFMVPRAGRRETRPVHLPLDPYLLGAWLGDGSTGACNITAGAEDVEQLRGALLRRGIETHHLVSKDRATRISFSNRRGFGADMGGPNARALRSLACFRDKHIPQHFMQAGTDQRLELLRGLMDTDGCLSQGGIAIFVGRQRLCGDVLELLRSLGQMGRLASVMDPRSRDGQVWRISFTPREIQPFALPRKASRIKTNVSGLSGVRGQWASIASIAEVESAPVRSISVDSPTHLHQAGEAGHITSTTHH